jgi:multiple sugar transport system permease protein
LPGSSKSPTDGTRRSPAAAGLHSPRGRTALLRHGPPTLPHAAGHATGDPCPELHPCLTVSHVLTLPATASHKAALSPWALWGRLMVVPYLLVFLVFVLYPVGYGLWLARHPASYSKLFEDPIFFRTAINTVVFVVVAVNLKMVLALALSGFFLNQRWWVKVLSVIFILPWAVPSIPTILSVRFMLNPEWGVINSTIFRLTGIDGPNWLNDPTLALSFSMLMHIWKSLPFWTLILLAGRMAIPSEQYEAASVDGATRWQKFRFITWPAMRGIFFTSTILSMIWTLGDFNSVYLLTGGGPADLTHVLATLGIRYLRLDQVQLAMAAIVVALPLVLPLVYVMMKRLSK